MVYLYKKPIGNKIYYYLRASVKKQGKLVTKDIAYLGSSIGEVKKSLENLPAHYEKIKKAYKTINNFLESNHYLEKVKTLKLKNDLYLGKKLLEIEACKLHFNTIFKNNQELTKDEIWKNFIIEFAYNTTSIEGNTIKLNEARNLLYEGIAPKEKTLREIYDIQNTEKVFLKLLNSKEEISHKSIINIHKELMEKIDARVGYRTQDVRIIKSNFNTTPAPYVKTDMDLLLKWYKENEKKFHPFVLGTIFHHKFEKIHPFMDGNGRAGRIILNYILLKNEYPPVVIRTKTRKEYLQALRTADKSKPQEAKKDYYEKLVIFNAEELTKTYWNTFL